MCCIGGSDKWFDWNSVVEQSYKIAEPCDQLYIRSDLYSCERVKPSKKCSNDSDCGSGELCGILTYPSFCMICNTSKIDKTWVDQANVTVNVTESMLRGHFWNTEEFYNHTGVDLILTLYIHTYKYFYISSPLNLLSLTHTTLCIP